MDVHPRKRAAPLLRLALAGAERDDHLALGVGDRLDDLLLALLELLVVLAVAEDAEVAGGAAVRVDGDAGEDLLALVEAEALHVEVGEPDAVRGVVGVLPVVGVQRDLECLEVLGDLGDVGHDGFQRTRCSIAPTSSVTVGAGMPWRRAARRTAPGIASSSGSRPAETSR